MKAIEAKDLKVGELYYDTEFMDEGSTILKFEKADGKTLQFTFHSGVACYSAHDGFIEFFNDEIFYQP